MVLVCMQKKSKDKYMDYVYSTIGYGLFGVFGVWLGLYSLILQKFFLLTIAVLITFVALDNFFCGARAKKCGVHAKTHYIVPHFLKKR
jgi:hypothetical protein